jgi:hypothetical protein
MESMQSEKLVNLIGYPPSIRQKKKVPIKMTKGIEKIGVHDGKE